MEHRWPGNIRELENVIHNAVLLCSGPRVTPRDLRLTTLEPTTRVRRADGGAVSLLDAALLERFEQGGPRLFERIEEAVMRAAYQFCESNQLQTARLLGISRNVVRARLIQFGEIPGTIRGSRSADVPTIPRAISVADAGWSVAGAALKNASAVAGQKL